MSTTTAEQLEQQYLEQWDDAPADYSNLPELNRAFIRGELYCTPYNFGPIAEETEPLRSHLLRLHDFGLLTHSSQPFEIGKHFEGPCCYFENRPLPEEKFSQIRQRLSLDFLIPSALISTSSCKGLLSGLLHREEIYISYFFAEDTENKVSNFPEGPYAVTYFRRSFNMEDLTTKNWEGFTFKNPACNAKWLDFNTCNLDKKLAVAKPVEVLITAKSWTEDTDILAIVLNEAGKAALTPSFETCPGTYLGERAG